MDVQAFSGTAYMFLIIIILCARNYILMRRQELRQDFYMTCFCTTGTSIRLGRVRDFMVLSILQSALRLTREGIFISDSIMSDLLWVD